MTNPNKRKGDKAEREAAELLTEVTGFECQRNLSAGIPGDVGDIHGLPNCVVQVADFKVPLLQWKLIAHILRQ